MTALQELERLSGRNYVGGEYSKSSGKLAFDVVDPATEDRVGQLADTTAAEVDIAVAIANKAQKAWRKSNALHRAELMHEVARRMKALKPVLAEMLTREMGKPFKESMDEVEWSITAVDYYAEIGRHENGRIVGPATDHQFHFVAKEPLGTVVIILPKNASARGRSRKRCVASAYASASSGWSGSYLRSTSKMISELHCSARAPRSWPCTRRGTMRPVCATPRNWLFTRLLSASAVCSALSASARRKIRRHSSSEGI